MAEHSSLRVRRGINIVSSHSAFQECLVSEQQRERQASFDPPFSDETNKLSTDARVLI